MADAPIRILHLIASNFVGGPEKQILHHAADVRQMGIDVRIGSFRDQPQRAEILERAERRGLSTYDIQSAGRFDPAPIWRLASYLKRERIDLLCTHGYKANVLGAIAKWLAGVPQVAFCRGWTAETASIRVYEFLDRRFLHLADRIVCVSEAQAKILAHNRRLRSRVSVVHNAVLDRIQPASAEERALRKVELGFAPATLLVGAVGRLSTEKGQRFLVEAAVELHPKFSNLKIVLLGEGRDRESLESRIAELGLKEVVLLPGFQMHVSQWMRAFDVLANCSLTEGLPNVVLEAMAVGTPVVATQVGGVPELIENGTTGVLVPAGNPAAMARGLAAVLGKVEYASSLGKAGQKWVENKFSPRRQRQSLLRVYQQCLGPGAAAMAHSAGSSLPFSEEPLSQTRIQEYFPTAASPSLPFISVVIPVRNEESHLGAVIQGLLLQDYPNERYEILVADGNSTDGTTRLVQEIAKSSPVRIKLLPNPKQLSSAGRNVGVRASAGEIVVFIDGHCHIPSRKLLTDTARLFQATDADCLCRPQPLTAPGGTWFQRIVADARASRIGHGLDSTIYAEGQEAFIDPTSSAASYKRSVFEKIGGYDERLDACEDVDFNYRVHCAGLRAFTSPCLAVQYQARGTLTGLWRQMVRYGKGRFRFVCLHPVAFSAGQAIPPAFVLWLLFGAIAAVTSSFLGIIFLCTVALYASIVIASSVGLGMKHGWRHTLTAPAVYGTIHLGLGFGFLLEAVLSWGSHSLRRRGTEMANSPESRTITSFPISDPATESRKENLDQVVINPPNGGAPLNALSIDVEDYFHTEAMSGVVQKEKWERMPSRVEANTRRLYELLAKLNVHATFFFLGWVAERFPGLVREALQLGHEIGCHSYWHRRVYTLDPKEFRADTLKAKQAIENACGVTVRGYRAPSFSIVQGTEWAFDVLTELGFDYDSSVNPIHHDLYNNASAPRVPHRPGGRAILELPIASTQFWGSTFPIGGGGYMRILPYAYTHWGLSRFVRLEARPAVMYFHPWEIDPGQPRLAAPPKSRFRQYTGLGTTEQKLEKLLGQFAFAPISTVFEKELLETTASRKDRPEGCGLKSTGVEAHRESALDVAAPTEGVKWSG